MFFTSFFNAGSIIFQKKRNYSVTHDGVESFLFLKECFYALAFSQDMYQVLHHQDHGLRTPNEGINQRYLKNWADVADKFDPI